MSIDNALDQTDKERCWFCNEDWHVAVFDLYDDRKLQMDWCCEGARDDMIQAMEDSRHDMYQRKHFAKWFYNETGYKARSMCIDQNGEWIVDYGLTIRPISQLIARGFIGSKHAFGSTPAGWKWGLSAWNGNDMVGVAWCGRPVGRYTDRLKRIEVSRLAVDRQSPSSLVWNACSQLYGAAARRAKKEGYHTIQTYITDDEEGTSLKAVGWTFDGMTKGGSRANQKSRIRQDVAPTCPKKRYVKKLNTPVLPQITFTEELLK